ncbi:hypothetical protein ACU6U9_02785 [Pseudomonas sp. HK3]
MKNNKYNNYFNIYYVYRYLPLNGAEYQAGDKIELTDKQARFHEINGFIGKTPKPAKKVKEPQTKQAS